MNKLCISTLLIAFLFNIKAFCQDATFSQYYANPIYLNPAFAGSEKCPRLALSYRNQFPEISQAFQTYSVSYDQFFDVIDGGVGIRLANDRQASGLINTFEASVCYSHLFLIKKKYSIRASLEVSYRQKTLDWNNLVFPDMIDIFGEIIGATGEPQQDLNHQYIDFAAGVVFASPKFFAGVAAHHLTEPYAITKNDTHDRLHRKYTFHAGANIRVARQTFLRTPLILSPNIIFEQQQTFQQLSYGTYVTKKPLVVGVWFRHDLKMNPDAMIFLIGTYYRNFKFGYSYDLIMTPLRSATLGTHEITFGMIFDCSPSRKKRGAVKCPEF